MIGPIGTIGTIGQIGTIYISTLDLKGHLTSLFILQSKNTK